MNVVVPSVMVSTLTQQQMMKIGGKFQGVGKEERANLSAFRTFVRFVLV